MSEYTGKYKTDLHCFRCKELIDTDRFDQHSALCAPCEAALSEGIKRPCFGWKLGQVYDFDKVFLVCVGEGWRPMVSQLFDDIVALGWNRSVHQVKEKWGGLRFYIGSATGEIFDRIHQAEEDSFKICEQCGAPGKLRNTGWVQTLCDAHTPPELIGDTREVPQPITFTIAVSTEK